MNYDFIKDIIIPLIGAIGGIISCLIAYKVYSEEKKPKISLDYNIIKDNKFDKCLVDEYLGWKSITEYDIGFNKSGESYNVYIKIKNNSKYPITNFVLTYELIMYKSIVEFENDDPLDATSKGFEEFNRYNGKVEIDYIPPEREIEKWIFISYVIPKCKVNILGAKSKERKYFSKKFTLLEFDIFEYVPIGDSNKLRALLGVNKV